jgi:hypothetical protein
VRGEASSWVLRFTSPISRKRREMGLGVARRGSLAQAGDSATGARDAAHKAREQLTLCRVARTYHETVIEPNRTPKHAAQWIASLEHHVPEHIWHAPIDSIEPPELLDALLSVRSLADPAERVPETLQRVRQRLDGIFENASFRKPCATTPLRPSSARCARRSQGASAASSRR